MRRVLVGVAAGAVVFGAGFAGAKVENVTNPLHDDLQAAGWSIWDGGVFQARNLVATNLTGENRANLSSVDGDFGAVFLQAGDGSGPGIRAGNTDPNTGAVGAGMAAGSLYIQHRDTNTGALWIKEGSPATTTWVRISP